MKNCFCGMDHWWNAVGLISSREHCWEMLPLQTFETPQEGFEPTEKLSSELIVWSCGVLINS